MPLKTFPSWKKTLALLTGASFLCLSLGSTTAMAEEASATVVKLKNIETNRYAFSTGEAAASEGGEGGWLKSPAIVGADANYYNRAQWYLIKRGDFYLFKNTQTNRYLFSTGKPAVSEEGEGGWLKSPPIVGADANYYERAKWRMIKRGNVYLLKNKETNRYLFSTGAKAASEGGEGGWLKSPDMVGADANYYNRAMWHIIGFE